MYGYVYETTCLANGKKYIGRHRCTKFDPNYLGSGVLLQRAIKKYGFTSFTVRLLTEASTEEELCQLEVKYISEANAAFSENYYNITGGGETTKYYGGWGNYPHPNKGKPRLDMIGPNNPNHKSNGRISEETKIKLSNSQKQRYIDNPELVGTFLGKHHSSETKQKMREKKKGKRVVNDGKKLYWINPDEVENYLSQGFKLGKINKTTSKGRVWMNNGTKNVYPLKQDVEIWLNSGYIFGFLSKR